MFSLAPSFCLRAMKPVDSSCGKKKIQPQLWVTQRTHTRWATDIARLVQPRHCRTPTTLPPPPACLPLPGGPHRAGLWSGWRKVKMTWDEGKLFASQRTSVCEWESENIECVRKRQLTGYEYWAYSHKCNFKVFSFRNYIKGWSLKFRNQGKMTHSWGLKFCKWQEDNLRQGPCSSCSWSWSQLADRVSLVVMEMFRRRISMSSFNNFLSTLKRAQVQSSFFSSETAANKIISTSGQLSQLMKIMWCDQKLQMRWSSLQLQCVYISD